MASNTFLDGTIKCPTCGKRFGECHHLAAMAESDVEPGSAGNDAQKPDEIPPPALDVAAPFVGAAAGFEVPHDEPEPVAEVPAELPDEPDDKEEAPLDFADDDAPVPDLLEQLPVAVNPPIDIGAANLGNGDGDGTPDRTSAEADFLARMAELGDQPNVALIGYKTAGKTWLLHRLKHHLFEDLGANLDPEFETVPEEGQLLPGTSEIEFHDIVDAPAWTIVDTPGEYTAALIAGKVESLGPLVAVLKRAKAIIITLPADTLVFGPHIDRKRVMTAEVRREIASKACGPNANTKQIAAIEEFIKGLRDDFLDVDRFAKGMFRAAATLSYVNANNINPLDAEDYKKVTWAKVRSHIGEPSFKPIGGLDGLDCPVFVALTKADRVVSILYGDREIKGAGEIINLRRQEMLAWPETKALRAVAEHSGMLDQIYTYPLGRPSQFVRMLAPALHTRLVRFCPMSRFDFISAFFGHDYTTSLKYGHYAHCPQWGVDHMFKWMRDAIGLSRQTPKRKARQALARRLHFAIHGIPQPGAASLPPYGED
ncbi:MAG: hypothetical protein C0472_14530 [Erythrobacter sp.]|nr:hypothetical protein [Erythrobacter sp.]MBA4172365.1 hypothetical protein [Hyphomicrobium sp.]